MKKQIKRSLLFTLKFTNKNKLEFLDKLYQEYFETIEYFINIGIDEKRKPNYDDVKQYPYNTFLSKRYLNRALIEAQRILKSFWKARKRNKEKPNIKNYPLNLDRRFFKFELGKNSFDFWLAIRNPEQEKWIYFPIKNYSYAKQYFEKWKLCSEISLLKRNDTWYLKLVFKKDVELSIKRPVGIDIGVKKLFTTSDKQFFFTDFEEIIHKLNNKKQGSKKWKKLKYWLKTEINRVIKQLITGSFSPILKNLKNLKKNTKKEHKLNKRTRKLLQNWCYSYILRRIKEVCETRGVLWFTVPSNNTSRACPYCRYVDKRNRVGEKFKCLRCGFLEDADYVGALNILRKFLFNPIPRGVYSPSAYETHFYG